MVPKRRCEGALEDLWRHKAQLYPEPTAGMTGGQTGTEVGTESAHSRPGHNLYRTVQPHHLLRKSQIFKVLERSARALSPLWQWHGRLQRGRRKTGGFKTRSMSLQTSRVPSLEPNDPICKMAVIKQPS